MRSVFLQAATGVALTLAIMSAATTSMAEPRYAIAMAGDPALPPDFVSLPHVNPDAPKGGSIIFAQSGSFDSLNPHILKGRTPWAVRAYVFESLMGRSYDEPFTLYGLLAESIDTGPNREWVEFVLRKEARFSDGSPVTVEDVIWSYETLGTIGHPRYHNSWKQVEKIEKTGPRSVRITFNSDNQELALIMGLRPILKRAQWDARDFADSGVDLIPVGSSPYTIDSFEPGAFISLKRNPDYWGKDVPFMRGQANLDEIRYDYYGDGDVVFQAFKAGEANAYREGNAAKWESQYNFARVQSGDVVKSLITHQRPSGITGFVMNTRNPIFQDWRVREAMITAFNFEFINDTITGGAQGRITSYFSNSVLGMSSGPAQGRVLELLKPFEADLLPGALSGYLPPVGDGTERNRPAIAKALALMEAAGWTVQNGVMKNADGAEFTFEVLLSQGAAETAQTFDLYASALTRIGITPTITTVDSAQYRERTNTYDFDMARYRRGLSLSPGTEQRLYWGAEGITKPGTRNWMGMSSPAADAMIDELLTASSQDDFRAAAKALDRVLTTGRYVIPFWFADHSRLAHVKQLRFSERLPMYGDWLGFQPNTWWWEE
ncbi:MAG: extracellular solute-binding protein [Paracoccaceae bacterium]